MKSNKTASLDELGRHANLDQSSLRHGYLTLYEELLPAPPALGFRVMLFGQSSIALGEARLLSQYYPGATVVLARTKSDAPFSDLPDGIKDITCETIDDLALFLIAEEPFDLFIDHGNNRRSQKRDLFLKLFPALAPGGLYCVEDAHATWMDKFTDHNENVMDDTFKLMQMRAIDLGRKDAGPGGFPVEALASVMHHGRLVVARRSDRKLAGRIHESQSSRFFQWSPSTLIDSIVISPAETVTSRAEVITNRPELMHHFPATIQIPQTRLQVYEDVVCLPGQIVMKGNAILPESFRMFLQKVAKNRHLVQPGTFYARPVQEESASRMLAGTYLHIDNELDDHYGHITLEVVSKLWAWEEAIKRWPDLRLLAGAAKGQVSPVLLEILDLYGIPTDRVTALDVPARVERLVCPTQLYHIGRHASPRLEATWDRLTCAGQTETRLAGRKLFLSRPEGMGRGCRNQKDVESLFAVAGYDIVRPETFSLCEQITMLSKAAAIGGFAGSAMLNAIYARPGTPKTVIASETFNAGNDYLISTLKGGRFNYFFCAAEIQHPTGGWSEAAFMSPYSFDMVRDAELLSSVIQ